MSDTELKTVIISDAWGFGLLETKPHPLWMAEFSFLRNKALLVPEYGAMYVAAFLKGQGWRCEVLNLVLDVFHEEHWFREREERLPAEARSTAPVGDEEALRLMRENLENALRDLQPDVVLFPISIYYIARHAREMLKRIREMLPEAFLVAGGIYSTMHPGEIMEDGAADCVVRGEG